MKIIRILVGGISVTIANAFIGIICCMGNFNWVYTLEPTYVWKTVKAVPDVVFYLAALGLYTILSAVYMLLKKGIPGRNKLTKGFIFGLCTWLIGTLPSIFLIYTFINISNTALIYWLLMGLVQKPTQGILIAIFCEDSKEIRFL